MERQVPDVFDVFALGQQGEGRRGGVNKSNLAAPWEPRMREQGTKWAQRRFFNFELLTPTAGGKLVRI